MKWKYKPTKIGDVKIKVKFAWFPVLSETEDVWIWLEDYLATYTFQCIGYNCWEEEQFGWDLTEVKSLYEVGCQYGT